MAKTESQKLQDTVKDAATSVDTSQIESTATQAQDALKNSVETTVGSVAGQVEGGVQSLTQKFDKYQEKLSNLTTEGLIDEGVESLENMATDFVQQQVTGLLSKFGSAVNVTFSEPDSNGIVYPIAASLDEEGGVSGTVAAVLKLITGLGVDTGNLQKAIVEGSPQGIIDAGKDVLSGKMGAFDGATAIKSLTETAVTSVTDELETTVSQALASSQNVNTIVNSISAVNVDGAGNLLLTRTPVTSSRITDGNTDSAEFNTAIAKNKTNPLSDLNSIITDAKNIKQNLKKAESDLENLTGGKNGAAVLNSVTGAANARTEYTQKGDEYRSLIKNRVAKGSETGIIQGISTEVLTDVKKQIRDFAPRLTGEQVNQVINLAQGDAADISTAVRLLFDATGKPFDTIRQFVKSIDTTIDNATRVSPEEAIFSDPYVIGSFENEWQQGEGNPVFPYISSIEELQAELRNVNREVTEVVVHWTETHTDKNIGSEEINKYHLDLGLNGIGYHYVIRRDGSLQRGRPVNIAGQHAPTNNHDTRSIGIVFVGGINVPSGTPNPENFLSVQSLTRSQLNTFDHFCRSFYAVFPGGQIVGHSEIDEDEVDPGFEVIDYVASVFGKTSKFTNILNQSPLTVEEILQQ
jgi:hypothetical protein